MIRYTAEQKAEAMAKAQEIGISKASKALNISPATFYTWKKENGSKDPSTSKTKSAKPSKTRTSGKQSPPMKTVKQTAKTNNTTKPDAIQTARQLLAEDDNLAAKVVELQSEVAALHEKNAKLKKALAALLD